MISILRAGETEIESIFRRNKQAGGVEDTVSEIIRKVREGGDSAVLDFTERFDGVRPEKLAVSEEEIREALNKVEPEFLRILREAAQNIRAFHEKQKRTDFLLNDREGVFCGQKIVPIERVGLYVPGGTAAYPSTVLMDAIPAKIAGCSEIVMVTPPAKDGSIAPSILAAGSIAGVDRIFKAGGAQAIAALAYGTESIPGVDKIVGPGNAYVAEAKKQVFGQVSIDMIAGPSEILIIADRFSNPRYVAADFLSQAEHDRMAAACVITDSPELAGKIAKEIERQLQELPRKDIAGTSVRENGRIIVTENIEEAVDIANRIAPEHLELCVEQPFDILDRVRNAGSVFLGRNCPEALGDYFAGPNHTLPTSGTARFSSPLSVDDFVKKIQYTYYSGAALRKDAGKIAVFAEQEGLSAHARSVTIRTEEPV